MKKKNPGAAGTAHGANDNGGDNRRQYGPSTESWQSPLEPDREQIATFVRALFKHASAGSWVSLRAFPDDDDTKPFRIAPVKLNGNLETLIDQACAMAREAANATRKVVFCPPVATFTNEEHARQEDLCDGLVLAVELDRDPQASLDKLDQLIGPATIVVASGGVTSDGEPKLHGHWRLDVPARTKAELDQLKEARKIAAAIGGGDPTHAPVSHPIRCPGSWHRKGEPKLCTIKECRPDVEIELADALEKLRTVATPKQKAEASGQGTSDYGELIEAVITSESFHDPLNRLAAKVIATGMHADAAIDLLQGLMEIAQPHDERWQARYDDIPRAVESAIGKFGSDRTSPVFVSATDHAARARIIRHAQRPHLLHYRDDFVDWEDGAYRIIAEGTVNAEVWDFLDNAITRRKKKIVPFQPNRASVGETFAALKAGSHLSPKVDQPHWLDGKTEPPPREIVSFPNGLLDLRSGKLLPPNPAFFTSAALGFDYEPNGDEPTAWTAFLNEIFDGERDQIEALQETFGYLITGDVSQEKAFLLLGPKRSGKGTILRVLRCLLAMSAVADPSLRFLSTNFGLASLIGKQLAIVDDLRLGPRSEQNALIENILKITGRGRFTIDRKFKEAWHGILPVKLVMVSNEMPKLGDESTAVASRFIIFNTRTSFYGRENPRLFEDKLEPERVGILHWALDGLHRMRERGRLVEPKTSRELQDRMANLGSDARAFITEHAVLEPDARVPKTNLFGVYCGWCKNNEIPPSSKEKFCEAIYAATDGRVRSAKPREADGTQVPSFIDIRLRRVDEEDPM